MTSESPIAVPGAERLRSLLAEGRRPLLERVEAVGGEGGERREVGLALGRAHADVLDQILKAAFAAALEETGQSSDGIALAGVGGYGRGAVALGSDLDVRLLTRDLDRASTVVEALLYPLWDTGLTIGHQVVTPEDLVAASREDLPTATCLLDWRYVAGDRALSDDLLTRARGGVFSTAELPDFLDRMESMVVARHKRFGGSVYMLEPDVKNSPGALRDLDVARWAARARWNVGDFDELVRLGILVSRQLRAVEETRELLWRIRNLLHERAGRRSDRLGFDDQEAIAPRLGHEGSTRDATERLMRDYYRAARTVSRFRDMIMARARPASRRRRPSARDVGRGVQLFDGEATVTDLDALRTTPALALRLVSAAVDRQVPIRPSTRNAVIEVSGEASWCASLRKEPEAAELFVELVCCHAETRLKRGSVLRELHDLGLLLAMIPEFGPLVGRVHHDTYHVYTVDVHSVAAVDRLGEIIRGDIVIDEEEDTRWAGSLAMRLATEITRPRVLFFATLLHDVGKSIGRRDHSERGAELADTILGRLGFPPAEVEEVAHLILHHLTMYLVATRRDLDDPATADEFAELVRSREGLRDLYLLTVADLSTTSPTSMTSWKARMLDELYMATDRAFGEGNPSAAEAQAEVRAAAAELTTSGDEQATITRFLEAMPPRYAQATPPEAVVTHARLVERYLRSGGPVALEAAVEESGMTFVAVVAPDRPGLLAQIAAALTGARMQVHAAQIYSLCWGEGEDRERLAMDLFYVEHDDALAFPAEQLQATLVDVIEGRRDPRDVAARRSRRADRTGPEVPTRVVLDNRAAPEHTVVEVIARDRAGLLFELSHGIYSQGLSIAVAKIATEGTRVVDVFYVSEEDGSKLNLSGRGELLREALHAIAQGANQR